MTDKLKPCPFCGSEPHDAHHIEYGRWAVTCNCGVMGACANTGPNASDAAKIKAYNDARHAWNTRALTTSQPAQAPYGYCPECGAPGVMRERRPDGDDKCSNGHRYPSRTAHTSLPTQPAAQAVPEQDETTLRDIDSRADSLLAEAQATQQAAGEPVGKPLQGGLDNDALLNAWRSKLPGVTPTDAQMTAFALGVEVGFAHARTLERSDWSRVHDVLKKAGVHPGRTDDHLADVIAKALFTHPATGVPAEVRSALEAASSACDRVIDQDEGVLGGIDFHALKLSITHGLAALAKAESADVLRDAARTTHKETE